MRYFQTILTLTFVCLLASCNKDRLEEKGFQINSSSGTSGSNQPNGLNRDSLKIVTQPSSVLLTGVPNIRLNTMFKVNKKKDNTIFIGSNTFHYRYEETDENGKKIKNGNNWNNNLMPGLGAVYGYNMVNVSHYDFKENKKMSFFDKPVLVRTLYYPTFSKDTLNNMPIKREYFMVSVYNDDTNKDGFVNLKDLRRFYLFNIKGEMQKALVPENYSVFKSEYDSDNDFMYVFAQMDSNNNGRKETQEPIHVFWIDLKNPMQTGRLY